MIKALEIWLEFATNDDDTIMWRNWRTEKLKLQTVHDVLPELKGMF
jgi:hypothetical protein